MRLLNILCVGAAALSLAQPLLAEQQASTNQDQKQKQNQSEGQGQEQGRGLSYPKSKLQAPLGVANEAALGANADLSQTDGGRSASPSRLSKVVVSHHRHHHQHDDFSEEKELGEGEGEEEKKEEEEGVLRDSPAASQRCLALATTFKPRDGRTLQLVFSQYYPQGSNPSLELLSSTYPAGTIPTDVDVGAILASVGPDVDLTQEGGYGYQTNKRIVHNGPSGGLPAFCRFGAFTQTSALTRVLSEVWMPLAENRSMPVAATNQTDHPSATTGLTFDKGGVVIKQPPHGDKTDAESTTGHKEKKHKNKAETNKLTEETLLDTKPSETKPSAGTLTENKTSEKTSTEAKPSEKTLKETKPPEKEKPESNLPESKPSESKLSEIKPSVTKPDDIKPADAKAADAKAADAKAATGKQRRARSSAASGAIAGEDVFGIRHGGWNGRLLEMGNGAQRGFVPLADLKQMMSRYRFAVAGSNLGHFATAGSSTWVNGSQHEDTLLDWSTRAHHVTRTLAEDVLEAFYGQLGAQKSQQGIGVRNERTGRLRSYHAGCSNGGGRALAAVQDMPLDYDGVLAGAPTLRFSDMNLGQLHQQSVFNKSFAGDGFFSRDFLYDQVQQFILGACDALDGVKDGVLSDPFRCRPDFSELLCTDAGISASLAAHTQPIEQNTTAQPETTPKQQKLTRRQTVSDETNELKTSQATNKKTTTATTTASQTCLTPAQLANLRRFYSPTTIDGKFVYAAYPPGVESGAGTYTGAQKKADQWLQLGVQGRASLNRSLNPFKDYTWADVVRGRQEDHANVNSAKTDLKSFLNNGAKLIVYHGLADPVISAATTVDYYRAVQRDTGSAAVRNGVRFYEVPGMHHCRDGPGPWHFGGVTQKDPGNRPLRFDTKHDMVLAMVAWAERGIAPDDLVAAAYNKVQKPKGSSSDDAASPSKADSASSIGRPIPSSAESHVLGVRFTRKLCPHPKRAIFQGGDGRSHQSFRCV